MKLLSNYYRSTITATVVIVILSSCAYFFIIHYILLQQLDNTLEVEEAEVIGHVKETGNLPEPSVYKDQQVLFNATIAGTAPVRNFSTIKIYNKEQKKYYSARRLVFSIEAGNKTWLVTILKSQEETEDIVQLTLAVTLVIVVSLMLILFLINRFVLQRLWKPFHSTLTKLKAFNLAEKMRLDLQATRIDEFNELNSAVKTMTDRVRNEYNLLKEFTDNASHELQTPLAIINSKLDLLIQDDSISERQMNELQFIYDALNKMSRMNQSLLLLARIENNQFSRTEKIALHELMHKKLLLFEDQVMGRELTINANIDSLTLLCNEYLLDVLVSNLISNAVYYCDNKGTIAVTVNNRQLIISNTSLLPALDKQKIFKRFYRHENTGREGNGLGLSIIQQVCNASGYSLNYFFENGFHNFQVIFN